MAIPAASNSNDDAQRAGAEGAVEAAASPAPKPAEAGSATDTAGDASPDANAFTWLRRGDQIVVGLLVAVAIGLMTAHWVRLSGWGLQPVEIERIPARQFDFQIDINSATWVEWMQLEGIGDTLAHRIVNDRQENGPFTGIDDIARVNGVGPKTVEKMRPWLRVDEPGQQ